LSARPCTGRLSRLSAAAAVLAALLLLPVAAAASTNVPFAGSWRAGVNVNNAFRNQTWNITSFDAGTGAFSGSGTDDYQHYGLNISGTISGDYTKGQGLIDATVTYPTVPARQTTVKLHFGSDANSAIGGPGGIYPGGFTDSTFGPPGTFAGNIARIGPPPNLHLTGTRVSCNRGPNPTDDFQCTAEVGDAAPELPTNPTGTVTFSSTRGTFRYAKQCVLRPSTGSGSVSACAITWIPPAGGLEAGNQPDVVADYPGDAGHAPSTGTTQPKIAIGFTVPFPPTAATCSTAANDAEKIAKRRAAGVGARAAGRRAHAALNTFTKPQAEKEWGAWVYYNAATCKNAVGTLFGYAFKAGGVVLPIGANIAVALDPEPVSKGGLYVGTNLVVLPTGGVMVWAGGQMVEGADKSQKDPPDRRYKVYAGVRHTPRVRVRSGNGISRPGASALGAYLTAQLRAGALGKAVGATVDKAGGAQKARNRTWQGRQIRRALRYARALVSAASALPKLRAAAARALRSSPQFSRAPSRRAVLRSQARLRRSGFTRGAVALLRRLGLDSADIRSLRRRGGKVKLGGDLRPIAMLSDPRIDDGYRATAAYFRLWASSPQTIAASKLR